MNRLTSVSGGASFAFDPAGGLYASTLGSTSTTFSYDGADITGEHTGAGTLLRRYVHGPGVDEPLVWYEGTGTTDRRFLLADERGSVVSVTDAAGNPIANNTYDEYGKPGSSNLGRFQYTGQIWSPEAGLYHYKARCSWSLRRSAIMPISGRNAT